MNNFAAVSRVFIFSVILHIAASAPALAANHVEANRLIVRESASVHAAT
jgi:hypothetical protein